MANRVLLCLVLVCVLTDYSLCGRFSFGGRAGGGSRSSWGGGGRSRPATKPSYSNSRHKYPPSGSSNLSGFRQGSHKYPTSPGSSSLSGFGQSSHKYPLPSPGSSSLSGFGQSSHSYPLPSPGSSSLSGFGKSSHNYPTPSSGSSNLSGFGQSSHKYPSTLSGLSGSSSGGKPAFSGSGSASKYPPSPNLSGYGSGSNNYSPSHVNSGSGGPAFSTNVNKHNYPQSSSGISGSHNYNPTSSGTHISPPHRSVYTNTHSGIGPGHTYNTHNVYNSYASAPQQLYITEYRQSNSRFSDILTGLALYNLGRSHNSNYDHHYYHDDYYSRRYNSPGSSYNSNERPKDEAHCTLRITDNNKLEVLKIPCEIVSTFTEGSKKLSPNVETQTVCVSNHTVINNTQLPTTTSTTKPLNNSLFKETTTLSPNNETENNVGIIRLNATNEQQQVEASNSSTVVALPSTTESIPASNISTTSTTNVTTTATTLDVNDSTTTPSPQASQQDTISSTTAKPMNVNNATLPYPVTSNITVINSTKCTTTTDPLTVKGPPIDPTNMKCEVEIITKTHRLRNKVNCQTLIEYSKMPEPPKKESAILPSKGKLKSWLSNPPWWMSIFIAL